MDDVKSNRQRNALIRKHGRPVLSVEFDVFENSKVAMWTHLHHDAVFADMKAAFEAILRHLREFVDDGDMCPFNPDFIGADHE